MANTNLQEQWEKGIGLAHPGETWIDFQKRMAATNNNSALIDSLRQAADYFERHPEIPTLDKQYLYAFTYDRDLFLEYARTLGSYRKVFTAGNSPSVELTHDFSECLALRVDIPREKICRQIVTWDCPDESFLSEIPEVQL